jgi:uncharacterized SAM-binding protein YcdF (DUF218 family)
MTRLVAVLGYSGAASAGDLHPVCRARLARAENLARPGDTVLLTGWARRGRVGSEGQLMAAAWSQRTQRRLVDHGARTTLGNAIAVGRAARQLDAREVVVVTSGWHARRAGVLVRAALAGTGAIVHVEGTAETATPRTGLRELAAWAFVPLLALLAVRTR